MVTRHPTRAIAWLATAIALVLTIPLHADQAPAGRLAAPSWTAAPVAAPQPAEEIVNPRGVAFTHADYDLCDGYEVDLVRESDQVVIQTLAFPKPAKNAQGEVELGVNVQPIAFGRYRFVARAVAGAIKSVNSAPSDVWRRGPVDPTGLRVVRE